MSQCLPGSSTPAKFLFFQTSARSCWATVMRLIVMVTLLSSVFTRPQKSPKPPHAYRTGIAFDAAVAGASAVVIARASIARALLQPGLRRTGHMPSIDAQGVIRAATNSQGRFGCGTFVPRWSCLLYPLSYIAVADMV